MVTEKIARAMFRPKVGEIYKHKNGTYYKVKDFANENAEEAQQEEYPLTIVYSEVWNSEKVWSQPLSKWFDSFTIVEVEEGTTWTPRIGASLLKHRIGIGDRILASDCLVGTDYIPGDNLVCFKVI